MSSPCTQRAVKLREKNRALLDQLESNSILLERRLQKLKRTARTAKSSDKSWQELPPSPLKRKYDAWKARNYSGQVSAALSADIYNCSDSSLDNHDISDDYKQKLEDITSPAKRTRHNAKVLSKPKRKHNKLNKGSQNSFKSSTAIDVTEHAKDCTCCYCKTSKGLHGILSGITSQEEEDETRPDTEDKETEESHSLPQTFSDSDKSTDSERQRKTLAAAHAIINYSPESIFLRRLKQRSQAVGDLIAPGNIRPLTASPSKKSPPSTRRIPNTATYRVPRSSPTQGEDRPFHSARPDMVQQTSTKREHPRRSQTKKVKKKSDRKRACYKKHCYCRVLKNKSKKELFREEKENVDSRATQKHDDGSAVCECCCNCSCQKHPSAPRAPLIVSDAVADMVDKEQEGKFANCRCCCKRQSAWFDKLNEFRQSHWFDCHAHPHADPVCLETRARSKEGCQPCPHKCVHEFTLDDRLFFKSLNEDHRNVSRCAVCQLPYDVPKSRPRETPPITLPSSLQEPEVQVSIPLDSFPGVRRHPATSGNVLSHKKISHGRVSPRTKRNVAPIFGDVKPMAPPPADSLALRYQKGVAK
ncbi:uncharacterized protein [Periplaneta americana]|uniref:uncharacterized protein n=1 Tax=Periplaneta americana TaxID=6978 RepID=UPI0037E95F14